MHINLKLLESKNEAMEPKNKHSRKDKEIMSQKYQNVRYFRSKDGIRFEILLSKPRGFPNETIKKSYTFSELMKLPSTPHIKLSEGFWFNKIDLEIGVPNKRTVTIRILLKCWRETSIDIEQDFYGIFRIK